MLGIGIGPPFLYGVGGGVVPPVPPGPYDRMLPAADSLKSGSTEYALINTALIVRIAGRNGANSVTALAVTVDGAAPDSTYTFDDAISGHPVLHLSAWKGLTPGTKTIAWACTGTAGFAAMRIGDVVDFDSFGDIKTAAQVTSTARAVSMTPQAGGASRYAQIAAWMDDRAYPMTQDAGGTIQWQTRQWDLGPELVTNGDFEAGLAPWTQGGSWTVADGVATSQAVGGRILQQATSSIVAGSRYAVQFDITATATGNMQFLLRTGSYALKGPLYTAVGPCVQSVLGTSGVIGFGVQGSNNAPAGTSIDNFSIKLINAGMAAMFVDQASTADAQTITYSSSYSALCSALCVEIKGLVLP